MIYILSVSQKKGVQTMEVVKVRNMDGHIRYYLNDCNGEPIEEVLKFLKFKDNTGYARNTLRMYCTHLKQYYEYLVERGKSYREVNIDDLAGFVAWLQNPYMGQKVVPIRYENARLPQTVNKSVDTVVAFYEYLVRHEEYERDLPAALVKFVKAPGRHYRSFLYGIADSKPVKSHVLKLKTPRQEVRIVKKENIPFLLNACTNLRDYLLVYMLFETGMRIGEALSLWVEDFDMSESVIYIRDRGEMENLSEIKTLSSPRRLDITQELSDLLLQYICEYHTEEIRTNHVFIKLRGKSMGKAMDYTDVDNLFRTLRRKTGVKITPHMFRHTSLSILYSAGWEPELLRKRAGHKNIYTTLNTYVHPTDEEVTEAFKKAIDSIRCPLESAEVHNFE